MSQQSKPMADPSLEQALQQQMAQLTRYGRVPFGDLGNSNMLSADAGNWLLYRDVEALLRVLLTQQQEHRPCPCQLTTPCHPNCTCVQPSSSRGCLRCCAYGSREQQVRMAERLAAALPPQEQAPATDQTLKANALRMVNEWMVSPADGTDAQHWAYEVIEACRQALESVSPPAPETWQPIATAPKDFTRILGFGAMGVKHGPVVMRWSINSGSWSSEPGAWEVRPTHWMPLPAAPPSETPT